MSLLAQTNQPNASSYYFALDTTPADPTVTAPDFVASGGPGSVPPGAFTALGDASPGGTDAFIMAKPQGVSQWGIGMANAPGGANSGNDFAIYSYADDGGFLGVPIQITRSTGAVSMPVSLSTPQVIASGAISSDTATVATSITVGTPASVGGGDLQVNGTLGVGQAYDTIYNPPLAGAEFIMTTTDNILTQTVVQNVTPTRTGPYVFTMEVTASATGLAFANGTAFINAYLLTGGPLGYVTDSYLCCDFVANPNGFNTPGGTVPPNTYVKDSVAIVNLQAGVTYSAGVTGTPGINLGQSGIVLGGIRCFIQPLLA